MRRTPVRFELWCTVQVASKKTVDVFLGEEVRCALRPVQHGQRHIARERRDPGGVDRRFPVAAQLPPLAARGGARRPSRSARPPWPPNRPSVNVDAAAEIRRNVQTAPRLPGRPGCRAPRADPGAGPGPDLPGASGSATGTVFRRASPPMSAPVTANAAGASGTAAPGPTMVHSIPAAPARVPHEAVGEAECQVVHGPRRRHAHVPVSEPPGPVLHGRLRARLEHLDRRAPVFAASWSSSRVWTAPAANAGSPRTA